MMTLTFGEEKRAKPVPSSASIAITTKSGVAAVSVAATARPAAHRVMPMVATLAAGKRSARRPHTGESTVCMIGWMISTSPASRAVSPLTYCR